MEHIEFDLADVQASFVGLLGARAGEKGLEIIFDQLPDVPTRLIGDPSRLTRVLLELGNNAVKFTQRGEIVLGVRVLERDDASVRLCFEVRDSGIGITPDRQQELLRLTGADIEGEVEAESEAGRGSCLRFTARLGVQSTQPCGSGREDLRDLRLLVVDDNERTRQVLVAMAQSLGMRADAAYDGIEALEMVLQAQARDPYGLLLIDWKMPQVGGIACLRAIRQAVPHGCAPGVLMATTSATEDLSRALAAQRVPAGGVLAKPVTPSSLLDACRSARGRTLAGSDRRPGTARATLQGARILLVEDNIVNQELARTLLGRAGIVLTVAEDGQQALDLLTRDAFDGVLMDCQMPVLDGYTATMLLRRREALRDLPVIAMGGDREDALAAGMNDQVGKPIDIDDLLGMLSKWIRPAAANAGASPSNDEGDLDALKALPGIDTSTWTRSRMGDAALYRRLLRMFLREQATFPEPFLAALADGDRTTMRRLAHNARSLSATLGAHGVARAARALEEGCVDADSTQGLQALLDELAAHLRPVLDGLRDAGL